MFACKQQDPFVKSRLKTAEQFVGCLKRNQPDSILSYSIQGVSDNIDDKEFRETRVKDAFDLISKYGLPPKDKWEVKYDRKNNVERLIVAIPFPKSRDSIFLFFPPPAIGDKVYDFEIGQRFDAKNAPLPTTKSIDSLH
jgi:hypothetical protein